MEEVERRHKAQPLEAESNSIANLDCARDFQTTTSRSSKTAAASPTHSEHKSKHYSRIAATKQPTGYALRQRTCLSLVIDHSENPSSCQVQSKGQRASQRADGWFGALGFVCRRCSLCRTTLAGWGLTSLTDTSSAQIDAKQSNRKERRQRVVSALWRENGSGFADADNKRRLAQMQNNSRHNNVKR
jgi:hypothetical protein